MDEIRIEKLEVYAYHGVYASENEKGQRFYINAVLYTDTRRAGKEDDLELSTHYGEVCTFIHNYMTSRNYALIEAVAENLAEQILLNYHKLCAIDLEIRKPEAPIELPFESVSVKINRGWHRAVVALGSNLGDREKYIKDAVNTLNEGSNEVEHMSDLIETKPYGNTNQDNFLNGVLVMKTLLSPNELLQFLHNIEQMAGRERKEHWGPRTLDLDIIFYDNIIMNTETLSIPHIDMENREFVLRPLAQLMPYYRHPVFGKTVGKMLAELL